MNVKNQIRSAPGVPGCRGAVVGLAVAVLLGSWAAGAARACRTPVYRYAMLNWQSSPYYLFHVHPGQIDEHDEAINKLLTELSRVESSPANLVLEPVDTTDQERLDRLPTVVTDAWKEHSDGSAPIHLVFSPRGAKIYAGRLDQTQVRAMFQSPVRKQLGELLQAGNAGVMLILTGPDEKSNQAAEKAVEEAIRRVADEIPVDPFDVDPPAPEPDTPDSPDLTPDPAEQTEGDEPNAMKVAVLKVSRTDPVEKWLVDSLLVIEPDLRDPKYAKSAMVFPVFGRGLAMPPYLDKGITADNLLDCVAFLAGPCSCQIKGNNPGMDLPMQWDWNTTAEALATEDDRGPGGLYGNGYQENTSGEPGSASGEPSAEETPAEETPEEDPVSEAAEPPGSVSTASLQPEQPEQSGPADRAAERDAEPSVTGGQEDSHGAASPDEQAELFAARQAWRIGIAVAVGAVAVLAAGLVLIRRQGGV